MSSSIGRFWRVLATGFSFALFGVGGVVLRVLVFPLLALCVHEPAAHQRAARGAVSMSFRAFVGVMRLLGVLRYEVRGLDKLDRKGQLILANHPTLIDTVFLIAFVPNADCIVKGALSTNPFMRGPIRAAGYIRNDRGPDLVGDGIASLRAGGNLIIFPEGTRTPPGSTATLKRGAANIAVRGLRAITPVVIRCNPPTLGKGDRWWHVPPHQAHFRIDVLDDIAVDDFVRDASEVVAARRLTDCLQQLFMKESQHHA